MLATAISLLFACAVAPRIEQNIEKIDARVCGLFKAFGEDGYDIKKVKTYNQRIGIMAEHRSAVNYETKKRKRVYYVEGNPYEMGYLLGLMAEEEIHRMTTDFTNKIIPAFINSQKSRRPEGIRGIVASLVYELSQAMGAEIPSELRYEMKGIVAGCKHANPKTQVSEKELIALNVGFDVLLALVYRPDFLLHKKIPDLRPEELNLPLMCNGFAIFDEAAGNGHYFGRDFMFPTAGVFHDTACLMIYNPSENPGRTSLPIVSMTAPGMVGSIAAMNINGVAVGVDMSPGANCDPSNVGINSLLLVRHCTQGGRTAEGVVETMTNSKRGVSWTYIVADGTTNKDKACVVEAGCTTDHPDFLTHPPKELKKYLPDENFMKTHPSAEFRKGMMVRWAGYQYPDAYLTFNGDLWKYFGKKLHGDAFDPRGYINKFLDKNKTELIEENCPFTYYFAPQRETTDNIVMVTNHYLIPEMRFYAMTDWISGLVGDKVNDIQWRYDELNNQILTALETKGSIDYGTAKRLIDFLAPYGKYPSYYDTNPKSEDGKEIRIEGSTSLFDLKNRTVESHFGYYCDGWIKITLPKYVDGKK